jgi:hypothetical protein
MDDRAKCTVGISRRDPDGRWHLIGSGVCTMVDGRAFVLSAGRLLATVTDNLWLGGAGKRVQLIGAATFRDSADAPIELQKLDMGFAPLLQHELDDLSPLECVSPAVLDLEDGPPGQDYLAIAAADPSGRSAQTLLARNAPLSAYQACGVHPATHVVVDTVRAGEPCGLIGAGVWRPTSHPAGDLLTGIVVDVRPTDGGAGARLVATRAPLILMGILGFLGMRLPRSRRRTGPRRAAGRAH